MNIKLTAAALLLTPCLFLTGCAMLDGLLLSRKVNDSGEKLFVDDRGTADPADDVLTTSPGSQERPNRPAYDNKPSETAGFLSSILGMIPGWGQVAGAALGTAVAGYAAARGYKKFTGADAARASKEVLLALFADIRKDWEADKFDLDGDGVVSLAEAAEYFKQKGLSTISPEGLNKVLAIISSALLDEPMKAKALDKLAGEM